ncbi:molybdate ABC transporter permease subunit [Pallidibacillus thermolactis]|jgi:molybdate transport system permease protein|uniref:molybdate ABC transporter permease subunit n=1 Tax=Pallidibacillus thermolactis TaxID=251051 RepID=UPI00156AA57E|nr:molybdate ABC transporter permease subunit [Pallidibacillus thermolactis]MCU9600839.1 molybdate ABC transporter permease subunit [Pallidibacillus thermolactis subsp. kokeshiiformis]
MGFSWHPVQLTIFVSACATMITFFIGLIAAYIMVKKNIKGKAIIETLFFLPLVLPPTVIGFLLIVIFGNNSTIGQVIEKIFGQSLLFTVPAAIIASVVVSFPLMYQSIKTGFLSVNPNIIEAARDLGATNQQILLKIIIPLSNKSIITGIILSFTRSFGEFGATLMFAGNIPGKTQTISTAIFFAIESGQSVNAWYYVGISILFSFILLFISNRVKVKQ